MLYFKTQDQNSESTTLLHLQQRALTVAYMKKALERELQGIFQLCNLPLLKRSGGVILQES